MLPEAFLERMKNILGVEYADFLAALSSGSAVRGLRANPKWDERDKVIDELPLTPLSYVNGGYILHSEEPMGYHPLHHSGAIYMQDPGAMATLSALDIAPDFKIIDLCAAPGGKSTQAAGMLGDDGFILANEFVGSRAKLMVGNFERLGIRNSMISSLDTAEFKKYFRSYFDLCIADVPCSGEGMFRKNGDATAMWSEDNVATCKKRQEQIIENAAPLVKAGGYLIYSTCTYSLEENEEVIDAFLTRHPEYSLVEVKAELKAVTRDGINFAGSRHDLSAARRFYPHTSPGEGQFIALLKKEENPHDSPTILYKSILKPLSKDESAIVSAFVNDTVKEDLGLCVMKLNDRLVVSNYALPPLPHSVLSYGVLIGEMKGRNIVPSHYFYSAFGNTFKKQLELSNKPDMLAAYLRGEQIPLGDGAPLGYTAVTYRGFTIGGGKSIGQSLNNHYPKGLRNKK